MKSGKRFRWLLLIPVICNLYFLWPHFLWSARLFRLTLPMSPVERRLAIMPSLYRDVLKAQQEIPPDATVWYVAPYSPHGLLYFLYPRDLRWGSPHIDDLEKMRNAHPDDWVIMNYSPDPSSDHMKWWPPIKNSIRQGRR